MIVDFKCKETRTLFEKGESKRFGAVAKSALRKLDMLDAAARLEDLRIPPSNHLERLHGDRSNQFSIRVNEQWRLCFEWRDGAAHNVEIVDYH